jgi:hypothetical protein
MWKENSESGNLEKSGHFKLWKEAANTGMLVVTYEWSSKASMRNV